MPFSVQQSGPSSSRRIVLVVLLVVALVMATVYAREGQDGPLHTVQARFMDITGQVGTVSAGLGAATDAGGDLVGNATANENTLSALREQNEQLRKLVAETEEYRQEALRLQGLLNMKQSSGVTGPTAHIVGRTTTAWDQSVTIDLGSEEGIESGMTVMGETGVIGQVTRTTDHTATVRLLSDPNSGAAAMIQSSRIDAIVRGSVDGLLYLEDLDEEEIPAVGDVVVTSGLGGSYERGLIIGTIVAVNKTATNPTGSIIVSPNGEVSMLEEVVIVYTAPDVAAKEKAEAEAKAAKEAEEAALQQQNQTQYLQDVYGYSDYATNMGYQDYTMDYNYGSV